jgi:phospholipase/carboxylesterase
MTTSAETFIYKKADDRQPSGAPRPALILLHGRGTDEQDLLGLAHFFDPRFLVYSLRAPFRFPFGGYAWFEADNIEQWSMDQLQISHKYCMHFCEFLVRTEPVDPSKIFLFGFSMGAMMALDLAAREEGRFAGVVAHSGFYMPQEKLPQNFGSRTGPIFLAHGTEDPVVPVELARSTFAFLQKQNVPVSCREYPMEHGISEESLQDAARWLQQQLDYTNAHSQGTL